VLRGLAWKGLSQLVLQGSRVAVAVVLARLLTPHEYGLAGMALVFSSLVLVFSDLALGAAVIQRRSLSQADLSTVFWTSVGAGAVCTAVGFALAGPLAAFYGQPAIRPLFAALAFAFLLTAVGTTQASLLTRELSFRAVELCLMAGSLAGGAVGIAAAAAGHGAWAIIDQQLVTAAVTSVLLWAVSPWRPSFRFSFESLRSLGGFTGNVFVQRLLYYLHRNTDNLLIGRFLGAAPLGAYSLAYNVMLVPFSRIAGPIQEVLYPAFARMQDDPLRIAAVWVRVTRLVAAISVPALLGLIVVAPDFVQIVLGPRWHAAGPVLRILAWVGLLQSLQTLNSHILQAVDRTSTLMRFSVLFFTAHLAAFSVGLHWGILGVAAGYAVSSTIVEPLYSWGTARILGVSPLLVPRALGGVFQAGIAMALAVAGVRLLLLDAGLGPGARLLVAVAVGLAVFLPCCMWRAPEVADELRRLRPRRA
jgi:O-antigen/teichoic acid export membrane protein